MIQTSKLRIVFAILIFAVSITAYSFTHNYGCQGTIEVYVDEEMTVCHPFPNYPYVPGSGWYLRVKIGTIWSHVQEGGGAKIVAKDGNCCTVKGMRDNSNETLELHCKGTKQSQGEEYICYWNVIVKRQPSTNDIKINESNFPDANFRNYLTNNFGTGGVIADDQIKNITSLDLSRKGICSLKGIEFFTALTSLRCDNNNLTSLDVSKNTSLKKLRADNNQLKGESMDALIASLPIRPNNDGELLLYYSIKYPETNWFTRSQYAAAQARGWTNCNYEGGPPYSGKAPIKGDANDNGVINEADIKFVVNCVMNLQDDRKNADVNGDNKVNAADIVEIVKIIKAQ